MDRSTCVRLAFALCVTLWTTACTVAPAIVDARWTGAAGNNDFNTPKNWSPEVVPTGTATIISNPSGSYIRFSAPVTSLAALAIGGDATVVLREGQSLDLKGLRICCASGTQMFSNGALTGNVDFGNWSGMTHRMFGASGTLVGDITQSNATFLVGSGFSAPRKRVLNVTGKYTLSQTGALHFSLYGEAELPQLALTETATLNGGVLLVTPPSTRKPVTFIALTAAKGIVGKFGAVQSDDDSFDVKADYVPPLSPTEVIVTVTPRVRRR